ncbi:MAG: aromatic ring-hydroxylating dioxygenase subunit alpha [Janthinobacterium lividum]
MLTRPGPVLRDGTPVIDLINENKREVSLRVMSDREVYDLEMERVFGKTWLLIGHECEIPKSGDFVTRELGDDPVIVARGRDGEVYVSLNVCPHRGMRVALTDCGNAQVHRCIYHGWAFRPTGEFIGAPIERETMHGTFHDKSELGLRKARVHVYGGMIFATWNIEGPSFEAFLGDMKWYLDMLFCRTDAGLELLGPPQRMMIDANWKTAGEQSASDGFHTLTLHRSLMEVGSLGGSADSIYENAPAMYGYDISSPHGHSLRCLPVETTFAMIAGSGFAAMSVDERINALPPPGMLPEMLPQLRKHLDEGQINVLATAPPLVGGMFPNLSILWLYAPQADGTMGSALALHTFVPRGPDHFEYLTWVFAEKDAPAAVKTQMAAATMQLVGISGTIEQDDADTWPHLSRNARGPQGRKQTLKYGATLEEKRPLDWPGPLGAFVYDGFTKDDTQWNWWLYYREMMTQTA